MTPLELRIIAYALAALLSFGAVAWGVHTLDAHHYERIAQADKLAQDQALQDAQQQVIAAQAERAAATQQVERAHELLVQADSASRAAVVGSVRNLETALHLGSLSAAVGNTGQSGGTTSGAGSTAGSAEGIDRLNASVERAIAACQHDSTELAGILALAPKVNP